MTKKPNEKRRQIAELYPHLTHLKSESGRPLCNTQGIKPEQLVEKDAQCHSCNKRQKRGDK